MVIYSSGNDNRHSYGPNGWALVSLPIPFWFKIMKKAKNGIYSTQFLLHYMSQICFHIIQQEFSALYNYVKA